MAKKPSSRAKRSKKSVDQSSVKGGGIMSLNKSNTSPFMKIVIIVIIVAMVMLFLYGGIAGLIELFKPQPKAAAPDAIALLKDKYDPQLQSWNTVLASEPTSYGVLVRLGSTHYDYAIELMKLASQNSTAAMAAAGQEWAASKDAYKRAVKANKAAEPGVLVDYSVATYYSGETTAAVRIAVGVLKTSPGFAPAFYNLGIFYEGSGDTVRAIEMYQKYLALDPTGKSGNVDFVKQQLKTLGASALPTSSIGVTGSAPATP
jgi:tetratricopeptide (TPR) repeat protein